jgi:CRISPR-associated endoribonuclease Cas6
VIWNVRTLYEEAYDHILKPLESEDFNQIFLAKKEMKIGIRKKELLVRRKQELLEEFYQKPAERYLDMEFITPTAFKSNGKYVIFPGEKYIFQSLMNKCSAAAETNMEMFDSDTLTQLTDNSEIVQYRLKSVRFPIEGIWIPAFKGEITLRVKGTDTLVRYARFLLKFGEYSGVGIKTAMGMGAIRLKERRETHDRHTGETCHRCTAS